MQNTSESLRRNKPGNLSERIQTVLLNPSFVTIHCVCWLQDAYENLPNPIRKAYGVNGKNLRGIWKKVLWRWHVGVHCQNQVPYKAVTWLNFFLESPFTTDFHSSASWTKVGYCKVFLLLLYHIFLPQETRYTGKVICCLWITLMQTKINS